jgi:hypothetical protein
MKLNPTVVANVRNVMQMAVDQKLSGNDLHRAAEEAVWTVADHIIAGGEI